MCNGLFGRVPTLHSRGTWLIFRCHEPPIHNDWISMDKQVSDFDLELYLFEKNKNSVTFGGIFMGYFHLNGYQVTRTWPDFHPSTHLSIVSPSMMMIICSIGNTRTDHSSCLAANLYSSMAGTLPRRTTSMPGETCPNNCGYSHWLSLHVR